MYTPGWSPSLQPPIPSVKPIRTDSATWVSTDQSASTYIADRFGVRLRDLRRSRRMTQLEMSIEFGIDRSHISDIERGKKAISLPLLEVIAIGFGLSLSDLLSDI